MAWTGASHTMLERAPATRPPQDLPGSGTARGLAAQLGASARKRRPVPDSEGGTRALRERVDRSGPRAEPTSSRNELQSVPGGLRPSSYACQERHSPSLSSGYG